MNHQVISFVKSGIRIIGYGFLIVAPFGSTYTAILAMIAHAGYVLILAEVLGILEEVGPWQTK